jgi:hypothetical protein
LKKERSTIMNNKHFSVNPAESSITVEKPEEPHAYYLQNIKKNKTLSTL